MSSLACCSGNQISFGVWGMNRLIPSKETSFMVYSGVIGSLSFHSLDTVFLNSIQGTPRLGSPPTLVAADKVIVRSTPSSPQPNITTKRSNRILLHTPLGMRTRLQWFPCVRFGFLVSLSSGDPAVVLLFDLLGFQ